MAGQESRKQGRGAAAGAITFQRIPGAGDDLGMRAQLKIVVADQVDFARIEDFQSAEESRLFSLVQFVLKSRFEGMGQGSGSSEMDVGKIMV